jgi:ribonuclease HI
MATDASAKIFIDGGSRGNPGPASYAVVLQRPGELDYEECDQIGTATNNVAEYTALIRALELAVEQGLQGPEIRSDSELMVKQIRGEYRVKSTDLQPLFQRATELKKLLPGMVLIHIPRAQNAQADRLCNEALDGRPRPPRKAPLAPARSPARESQAPPTTAESILVAAAQAWAQQGLDACSVAEVLARIRQADQARTGP